MTAKQTKEPTDFMDHTDPDGRRFRYVSLVRPGPPIPERTFEFLGVTRCWIWTLERLQKAKQDGLIFQSQRGEVPRLIVYNNEHSRRKSKRPIGRLAMTSKPGAERF